MTAIGHRLESFMYIHGLAFIFLSKEKHCFHLHLFLNNFFKRPCYHSNVFTKLEVNLSIIKIVLLSQIIVMGSI